MGHRVIKWRKHYWQIIGTGKDKGLRVGFLTVRKVQNVGLRKTCDLYANDHK